MSSDCLGLALGGGSGSGTTSTTPKRRQRGHHKPIIFGAGHRAAGPGGKLLNPAWRDRQIALREREEQRRSADDQLGPSSMGLGRSESLGGCGCAPGAACSCDARRKVRRTRRVVRHHEHHWPAEVMKDPGAFGMRLRGPSLSHNDPDLPHPNEGGSYWVWHPTQKRWCHVDRIERVARTVDMSPSHVVPAAWLPPGWPRLVMTPHPRGLVPPPPLAQGLGHVPMVVPAYDDPSEVVKHVTKRITYMRRPLPPAEHQIEIPGTWSYHPQHGRWQYLEPHTGMLGSRPTQNVAYEVSQAPAAAFEPRPPHLGPLAFWPDSRGFMYNAARKTPSNAPTTIELPSHVRALRSAVPATVAATQGYAAQLAAGNIQGANGLPPAQQLQALHLVAAAQYASEQGNNNGAAAAAIDSFARANHVHLRFPG